MPARYATKPDASVSASSSKEKPSSTGLSTSVNRQESLSEQPATSFRKSISSLTLLVFRRVADERRNGLANAGIRSALALK